MTPESERKTILVIDDMSVMVKILKKRLEHWGYRALAADNGEDGLALAHTEQPDLILLDILMPKMKGREVCARLKGSPKTRDIPVIFLSGLGLADHVRIGMELGAEDYIIKPFKPADLRERMMICLLRHQRHTMKA